MTKQAKHPAWARGTKVALGTAKTGDVVMDEFGFRYTVQEPPAEPGDAVLAKDSAGRWVALKATTEVLKVSP